MKFVILIITDLLSLRLVAKVGARINVRSSYNQRWPIVSRFWLDVLIWFQTQCFYHWAIQLSIYPGNPLSHHPAISPSRRPAVPPSRRPTIPPARHLTISPSHYPHITEFNRVSCSISWMLLGQVSNPCVNQLIVTRISRTNQLEIASQNKALWLRWRNGNIEEWIFDIRHCLVYNLQGYGLEERCLKHVFT